MKRKFGSHLLVMACVLALSGRGLAAQGQLKAGAAAVRITPYGKNPDWNGPITENGVWGNPFTDENKDGRWNEGEKFLTDPVNESIDSGAKGRYTGVYLAGFGNDRMATGMLDDLWARALVLESAGKRVAIVSVDLIGYPQDGGYFGLDRIKKLVDPNFGLDEILLTSTHNHEGPDTIGLWGKSQGSDGKFPRYLQFVDQQIAKAVNDAARQLVPVRMKLGATNPSLSTSLRDLQTRTDGRPPHFFDEELRVMQLTTPNGPQNEKVVATLVNWNTHPESMENENTLITSDFPGAVRDAVEKRYGGTAIYISGDLGAVEIVGDNERSTRDVFDGKRFPVIPGKRAATFTFARTEAIGRDVAKAAFEALDRAEESQVTGMDLRQAEFHVPMDNLGYAYLMKAGVLFPPKSWISGDQIQVTSTVSVLRLGAAEFLTTPGELFPEVFYGVEKNRRMDCRAADTGRPPEPALRPLMQAKYTFVLGLSPEELGYLVPGYDFRPPVFDSKEGMTEVVDACAAKGVPNHYHEINSASSQLAAGYACAAKQLLTGKPPEDVACKGVKIKVRSATT